MALKIEKAKGIGFCFGVKRAVDMLEKAAERGSIETLGAVVHNQPVLRRLAKMGITVAESIDDIKGSRVAISSHGVAPEVEAELKARLPEVIDTTCPFVHRAQMAAKRLAEAGFFTVIYGDASHPEIKSVLGWARGQGMATLDEKDVARMESIPRRVGILSQTTQIPDEFNVFVKKLVDSALGKDSELRIIDTVCHDIRERQAAALSLAKRVDLMLVIGGHTSANTKHLVELCAKVTRTRLVETAEEVQPSWLGDEPRIGIASGASTDEMTIDEVVQGLGALAKKLK